MNTLPPLGGAWLPMQGLGTYRPPIDEVCPTCGTKHASGFQTCPVCRAYNADRSNFK